MPGTLQQWIFDVNEESFQTVVVDQSHERPVVVDFWADDCAPCRMLAPLLEKIVKEHKGDVVLAKVDVYEAQQLAGYFGIESVPTVMAFKDGKLVLQFKGVMPEEQLRDFFARLLPPKTDPALLRAAEMEETKPAEAEAIYRKFLEKNSADDQARVGLARVLLIQNKDDEVKVLLEPIDADGPQAEEAQRILGMLSLRGLSAGSGSEADLRRQVESEPKNAQARYELGCLLAQAGKHEAALQSLLSAGEIDMKLASTKVREAMVQIFFALGQSHPLSDRYRAELARLLY